MTEKSVNSKKNENFQFNFESFNNFFLHFSQTHRTIFGLDTPLSENMYIVDAPYVIYESEDFSHILVIFLTVR